MATGVMKSKWSGELEDFQLPLLPSQISLSYKGKKSETEILQTQAHSYQYIKENKGTKNKLFFGDNLYVLSHLSRDENVSGKVDLVYIDPPFATGSVFKSRKQEDAYTDLLQGAEYIEYLRERLILLRRLMSTVGSIYLHLDSNMVFPMKLIMDEVFGEKNFRAIITRKKCNPKNYTKKTYGNISDFILFYTKTDDYIWNRAFEQWDEADAIKEYSYIDDKTGRRYKKVPIHAPGTRNGETGKPWRGMNPPPGKHWQYTPKKLDEYDARGEIYWSPNGNPRRKVFLDDSSGKPIQDIWLDVKDAHNQNIRITGYPTEKNSILLERIIGASSNQNSLILDCFAGSGTTLAVANELNRRWIGVDNSIRAMKTILKRFSNGTEMMGDFTREQENTKFKQENFFSLDNSLPENKADSNHVPITDFSLLCDDKSITEVMVLKELF